MDAFAAGLRAAASPADVAQHRPQQIKDHVNKEFVLRLMQVGEKSSSIDSDKLSGANKL